MKSLTQYILEKRQIQLFGDTKFNQFVIMAGGAASGKGYAQSFINADFKVLDVDRLKTLYAKMYPKDSTDNRPDENVINGWDFGNKADVSALHELVKRTGWKKIEQNIVKMAGVTNDPERLPNVLLDITGKDKEDLETGLALAGEGYNKTLVWVVQSIDAAIIQNAKRARKVDVSILLDTHNKSYKTVLDYVMNDQKVQFDHVWVYFAFNDKYVNVKPEEFKNRAFELTKEGNRFIVDQDFLNKIDEFRNRKLKKGLAAE